MFNNLKQLNKLVSVKLADIDKTITISETIFVD